MGALAPPVVVVRLATRVLRLASEVLEALVRLEADVVEVARLLVESEALFVVPVDKLDCTLAREERLVLEAVVTALIVVPEVTAFVVDAERAVVVPLVREDCPVLSEVSDVDSCVPLLVVALVIED